MTNQFIVILKTSNNITFEIVITINGDNKIVFLLIFSILVSYYYLIPTVNHFIDFRCWKNKHNKQISKQRNRFRRKHSNDRGFNTHQNVRYKRGRGRDYRSYMGYAWTRASESHNTDVLQKCKRCYHCFRFIRP